MPAWPGLTRAAGGARLAKAALPFIEDPRTLATAGMVRIVNGCRIDRGRVVEVHQRKTEWVAMERKGFTAPDNSASG